MITLNNISKEYKTGDIPIPVLNDVSVSFSEGCFTVIAGPSGSGKSTLLNILGALEKPDSGEYLLDGKKVNFDNPTELSEIRKNKFGFIFQSFNLIPVLTALENVELPLSLHDISAKDARDRAMDLLIKVGLKEKFNNKPNQLSGGEQQRVATARAMVTRPKFIFADEPTANLDRKNAEKVVEMMKFLNEELGVSFIFASHDDFLVSSAKEVLRIADGRFI